MGRLFGTDGARGIANEDLNCELALKIGRAAAYVLTRHTENKPKIVIGKDTRVSCDMLEAALCAGICSVGADVDILGVVPTPAVAYLVGEYSADAGIMISASHNPVEYNGIKLFSSTGYKLSDEMEEEIERLVLDDSSPIELKRGVELGRVYRKKSAIKDYIDHIRSTIDIDLTGIKVALDCANGSASVTASMLFCGLGAECVIIHDSPDGMNINENCGSTSLDSLIYAVKKYECDLGVAFDGDADRCLAVDENGTKLSGDQIIAILAKDMKDKGTLVEDTVVITVMSNFGMHKFAKENDINLKITGVGDRYVLEEMLKSGYNIGGEESGHIIFSDFAQTGDGQLSAVQLLSIYKKSKKSLSDLAGVMTRSPQYLTSVPASAAQKDIYKDSREIKDTIKEIERLLSDTGRVLVRPSGTENIIRVMIEGTDYSTIKQYCTTISEKIKEIIN